MEELYNELEVNERLELGSERLTEWLKEHEDFKGKAVVPAYSYTQAELLSNAITILSDPDKYATKEMNEKLYADICGKSYEKSFTNPSTCSFWFETGDPKTNPYKYMCYIASHIRDVIKAAYEGDAWTVLIWLELVLELLDKLEKYNSDSDAALLCKSINEDIYYFIHDYDELRIEKNIREMVVPNEGLIYDLVMNTDHSDTDYLYRYGEYITDNEIETAKYLNSMSDSELDDMARTYTEGYKKGFELAGIDLDNKETVDIRFCIGFEPMIKRAVIQFEKMGLKPIFRRRTNTDAFGVYSTSPNRQYQYDHRFDDALYLNSYISKEKLKHTRKAFEKYSDYSVKHAGPAVVEVFGEKLFKPVKKDTALKYTKEQEKISLEHKSEMSLLIDEFIPGNERSYTIIAYPIPEIGEKYSDIFKETIKLNNLDQDIYKKAHQAMIDALDEGEYVHVKGKGDNKTDIKVYLHELSDPSSQTNFENCLADVNIPVGEVFTSPVLRGTSGVLNVSYVYLNGLKYEDLKIVFEDGMVVTYNCSNYEDKREGRAYIKENVLHNHDTLPIGEFAIGTNTTAYVMAKKYDIEDKLPILIAEKTGPHFAVGDTCYSMSEDVIVHNPDGKEIIAKENEVSCLRKEDPGKAYFQCHTDITIPYEELESISVFTKDGKETIIIRDGRFVLPGTEELNKALEA